MYLDYISNNSLITIITRLRKTNLVSEGKPGGTISALRKSSLDKFALPECFDIKPHSQGITSKVAGLHT